MKKTLFTLACASLAALCAQGQDAEIFTAKHDLTDDGPYNQGRVRISATFDSTALGQWNDGGNAGTPGDGTVFHGFARYKLGQRDLFSKIDAAGSITWTTGLRAKEKNRTIDPVGGGHDVDVYLALDPTGNIVPPNTEPNHTNAWDWANEFGSGFANTVYLGRVPQSATMATDEEKNAEGAIPVDSTAMNISFDLTTPIKEWIAQGLLTADSTIAIGLVQRQAQIVDEQGNPKFDDPNLYVHSQMVFEVANAFITTSAGTSTPKGPGIFGEYDLINGYVNTGDWLGWVEVTNYPYCWVTNLDKYVFVTDPAGWVFVAK